eukprot:3804149-Amphidinium_carterae.5
MGMFQKTVFSDVLSPMMSGGEEAVEQVEGFLAVVHPFLQAVDPVDLDDSLSALALDEGLSIVSTILALLHPSWDTHLKSEDCGS